MKRTPLNSPARATSGRREKLGCPVSVLEGPGPPRQGFYQPCRRGWHRCVALRSRLPYKQKYCPVHLLPPDRDFGCTAEGSSPRDHRHYVGELSVHPFGRVGTQPARDFDRSEEHTSELQSRG